MACSSGFQHMWHVTMCTISPSLQPYSTLLPEPLSDSSTLVDPQRLPRRNSIISTADLTQKIHHRRSLCSSYWAVWKYESAACLLVLATPVVIFATLYPHNGQPLPQWPFGVSINSLLSVYALVLKASTAIILTSCIGQLQWKWFASKPRPLYDVVRFDQATRDASGALKLMWRQGIRQPLTTLGCAITILAFAIDPFMQQLLRPSDCSVELPVDGMVASLPVATFFERHGSSGASEDTISSYNVARRALENALYSGVFNNKPDAIWQCPTGNCTFPFYSTIGLCSSCEDVSADVQVVVGPLCSRSNYSDFHLESWGACSTEPRFAVNYTYDANEYIPMRLNMSYRLDDDILVNGLDKFPYVALAAAEMVPPWTGSPQDMRDHKILFGFLAGATTTTNGYLSWEASTNGNGSWKATSNSTCEPELLKDSWSCRSYGAAVCTMQPCVRVYNATVAAGVFQENLVTTMPGKSWGSIHDTDGWTSYLAMRDSQCSSHNQSSSTLNVDSRDRWVPFDLTVASSSDPATFEKSLPSNVTSLVEDGCLYIVDATDILDVLEGISGFVGTSSVSMGYYPIDDRLTMDVSGFHGPPIIRSIYDWGDTDFERVESIFSNISDSLTSHIRTHGRAQASDGRGYTRTAQGKVHHYATCMQVNWLWLLFPSILSSLTVLVFFLVAETSRRQTTPVWKVSPLAWILKIDRQEDRQPPPSGDNCEAMEDRSRQIAVQLDEVDGPRIEMVDIKDPHLEST